MKSTLARIANTLLKPLGARIVKNTTDHVEMMSAVRRIAHHGFEVGCVIDIGASDGKWSREVMEILPDTRFLAIEPLEERVPALSHTKATHGSFDFAVCVAGATDSGFAKLNVSADLDGSTVEAGDGPSREVPVRSLDGLVAERGLAGPFLLKFDTHGYEWPIIEGAARTLAETTIIIMEVYNFKVSEHGVRFHEMCRRLEDLGFRCYDMADPMLRDHDGALWQMDLVFCRQDAAVFGYEAFR